MNYKNNDKNMAQSVQLSTSVESTPTATPEPTEQDIYEKFIENSTLKETIKNNAELTREKFSELINSEENCDITRYIHGKMTLSDNDKNKLEKEMIKFKNELDSNEAIFTMVQVNDLPKNPHFFKFSKSKFNIDDLEKNNILHNLVNSGKDVTLTTINNLPTFVQNFHGEMHRVRYINNILYRDNDCYRHMLNFIQGELAGDYENFFQPQPLGGTEENRVIDALELQNYYYLLNGGFDFDELSTRKKSEICKCVRLHSNIIDHAIARGGSGYDRNTVWASSDGNITIFKMPDGRYVKYDPRFDLHLCVGDDLSYPALLLEEKPFPEDQGCADDRIKLAIMSKTACAYMFSNIGPEAIVTAVFVNGTTYEIYYGYFIMEIFHFRCVSEVHLDKLKAFKHAFWFYNLSCRPAPPSTYDEKKRAENIRTWLTVAKDREDLPSISERDLKRTEQDSTKYQTNVQEDDVQKLRARGFSVETPVDYDATNIFIPLDWSPNVVRGVRISDKLPIIAKLATKSEINIIEVLSKLAGDYIVKPLEIVQNGSRKFLVMQRYRTATDIIVPNANWWWTFAFALLQAVSKLHQANVTHSDIKPDHIALSNKNDPSHVLLLDFDASRKYSSPNVQVQGVVGTKGWMAPEVERNKGFYDPFKADIWSVGAVLEKRAKDVRSNKFKPADFIEWLKTTDPMERPTAAQVLNTYTFPQQEKDGKQTELTHTAQELKKQNKGTKRKQTAI